MPVKSIPYPELRIRVVRLINRWSALSIEPLRKKNEQGVLRYSRTLENMKIFISLPTKPKPPPILKDPLVLYDVPI
jgi:hypothetical protein